jgi:hypothetical protein
MGVSANNTGTIDDRMKGLRSRISDLGSEVDQDRAGIAASMGGGVFLLLLAAGAAYDLWTGKAGVWAGIGISRDTLLWVAIIMGAVSLVLIARAILRKRRGQSPREKELEELERQYADLLEQKRLLEGETQKDEKNPA